MNKKSLVELRNISLIDQQIILDNISFNINEKEVITIIGPNGAGKTSLIKIILKIINPTKGSVNYKSNLIIGYVPQKIHIDQSLPLTVKRFLQLSNYYTKQSFHSVSKELKICNLLDKQIYNLSGGEMQKILLARSLLGTPDLLVLDEPAQGVDIKIQDEMYNLIYDLVNKINCSVVLISHDLKLIQKYSNNIICLNKNIKYQGSTNIITNEEKFNQIFSIDN